MNRIRIALAVLLTACATSGAELAASGPSSSEHTAAAQTVSGSTSSSSVAAIEHCDQGGGTYAAHAYPGKSAQDLARVVALVTFAPGAPGPLVDAGYGAQVHAPSVRDGWVAITCPPGEYESVTFISP
jgi:hypothetical protein